MKKSILSFILILSVAIAFAQNVIYNLSGEATINMTVSASFGDNSYAANLYNADKSVTRELNKTVKVAGDATGTGQFVYDGRTYKTVIINGKEWMAENLAYLPAVHPPFFGSNTEPYYYVYGYFGSNVDSAKQQPEYTTYGVLYNWPAAMTACPPGWHLPTDAEWTELENYLIENGFNFDGTTTGNEIAKSLAATTHWDTDSVIGTIGNNPSLNNKCGFSALPGGYRFNIGTFISSGSSGLWCSATESSAKVAWCRVMLSSLSSVERINFLYKEVGSSVRCVRD